MPMTSRDVRLLQQSLNDEYFNKQNEERLRRARLIEKRAEEDRKLDEDAKKAKAGTAAKASTTTAAAKTDDKQPTPAKT